MGARTHDAGDAEAAAQWQRVRGRLRREVGDAAFKSWLKPLQLAGFADGNVVINAPSPLMREWVMSRYADRIRALWRSEDSRVHTVRIAVGERGAVVAAEAAEGAPAAAPLALPSEGEAPGLDPRFTFASFVVGRSNQFAHAAALGVADADKVTYNPIVIHGGVGLGKTHLLHAIAWRLHERAPQRRVLYLSAENFMYSFIRALRHRDMMAFKDALRSVDVLMIDDIHFIGGKDSTQEEFFHTFNALADQNKQLVFTADCPPSRLTSMGERLRSRLGWGLPADVQPTDYPLRLGILRAKLARLGGVVVPDAVLEFLAHRFTANVRVLEGALNRLVAHATYLPGHRITLEATHEILHDLLRDSERRITIEEIQKRVAEHFEIRFADMHSPRRARAVARPRQIAMYLAKQLTSRSLPEIGRRFSRDHTTVMHAVKKVEALCQADPAFAEDVELLRRLLAT